MLVELFRQSWQWRETTQCGSSCTAIWMTACIAKMVGRSQTDPRRVNQKRCPSGKLAMWQHLENVKQRLLEFSKLTIFILTAICLIHGRWIKSSLTYYNKRKGKRSLRFLKLRVAMSITL